MCDLKCAVCSVKSKVYSVLSTVWNVMCYWEHLTAWLHFLSFQSSANRLLDVLVPTFYQDICWWWTTTTTTTIVLIVWSLDSIPIHDTNTVVPPPQPPQYYGIWRLYEITIHNTNTVVPPQQPPPLFWLCEVLTQYQYVIPIQWYNHHNIMASEVYMK